MRIRVRHDTAVTAAARRSRPRHGGYRRKGGGHRHDTTVAAAARRLPPPHGGHRRKGGGHRREDGGHRRGTAVTAAKVAVTATFAAVTAVPRTTGCTNSETVGCTSLCLLWLSLSCSRLAHVFSVHLQGAQLLIYIVDTGSSAGGSSLSS